MIANYRYLMCVNLRDNLIQSDYFNPQHLGNGARVAADLGLHVEIHRQFDPVQQLPQFIMDINEWKNDEESGVNEIIYTRECSVCEKLVAHGAAYK